MKIFLLSMFLMISLPCAALSEYMRIPDNAGLWDAANRGDFTKVQNCLNQPNCNINTHGPGGDELADSPLMAAVRGGYIDLVQFLLDNGADPSYTVERLVYDPLTKTSTKMVYDVYYFVQPSDWAMKALLERQPFQPPEE